MFGRVEVEFFDSGNQYHNYIGRRSPFMLWLAIVTSKNDVILVNNKPLKWNIHQGFYGDAADMLGLNRSSGTESSIA